MTLTARSDAHHADRYGQAVAALEYAATHRGLDQVRGRTLDRITRLHLTQGEGNHAAVSGENALRLACVLRSQQVTRRLLRLRRALHPHSAHPRLRGLADVLDQYLQQPPDTVPNIVTERL